MAKISEKDIQELPASSSSSTTMGMRAGQMIRGGDKGRAGEEKVISDLRSWEQLRHKEMH